MTTDNSTAAETTATSTAQPPAQAPVQQPDYKALYEGLLAQQQSQAPTAQATGKPDEWKERAAGFQRLAQEKDTRVKELENQLGGLSTKVTTFESLFQQKEAELADLKLKEAELDVTRGSLERVTIIASEFPNLLPFLGKDDDLLPDGTGDELRGKLSKFQEKLGSVAAPTAPTKKPTEGATPTPPSGSGDSSYASLMQEALNALSRGDQAAYDQYYQKALAAT